MLQSIISVTKISWNCIPAEEVPQGQKVTINQSRAPILLYGSTTFTAVPQLFCNGSILYVFFAKRFSRLPLADLYDLGQ